MRELHELRQDLECLKAERDEALEYGELNEFNRLCDECAAHDALMQAQLKQQGHNENGRETEQEARSSRGRVALTGILWGRGGRDAARADNHARCFARDAGKRESLFGHFATLRCDNSGALGE